MLKLTGGGFIFSALTMSGCDVISPTPEKASEPWMKAGFYDDPRVKALSYAILAPNPHNRQPWKVKLVGKTSIRLYRDLDLNLPQTDPLDRQLTIGMGCFQEALNIAASHLGYKATIKNFPNKSDTYFAKIKFKKDDTVKADPLFEQLLDRRSCKEPFEKRTVALNYLDKLSQYANIIIKKPGVDRLKELTKKAYKVEATTPRVMQESIDLMRFGKQEINANPDGISLSGSFNEFAIMAGLLTKESMKDTNSSGFQGHLDYYFDLLDSTPAYAIVTTKGNSREDQVQAGKQWLRFNLLSTKLGLSLHPVSQALQEYDEMKSIYQDIHKEFAKKGETIQMLGRLGYGPKVLPAPRWPVDSKIT